MKNHLTLIVYREANFHNNALIKKSIL